MENATIRERALLHLSRFPNIDPREIFNIPFDLTQDGIATVLGISRAHASIELKKLKESGKVDDWQAHIKGSGTKRRAYYLLPDGTAEAALLRKRFETAGIVIDSLLDMKRCDPGIMWESLSVKDRETFGLACVFRVPIQRKTLPETSTGVIPADFYGMTCISENVCERYLTLADPEKIRIWHSRAADWWMDNGNDEQERLYHLANSGRNIEACKLLVRNSDIFLENSNEDLLNIVKNISLVPKYSESVHSIRARIALDCYDVEDALFCAEVLHDYLTPEADIICAEAALISGDAGKALSMATALFNCKPSSKTALIASRSLFALNRLEEASEFLDSSCRILSDGNDATNIDEMLILRAGIAYKLGKEDDAVSYLSKAKKASRKNITKERIDSLSDNIKGGKDIDFL